MDHFFHIAIKGIIFITYTYVSQYFLKEFLNINENNKDLVIFAEKCISTIVLIILICTLKI